MVYTLKMYVEFMMPMSMENVLYEVDNSCNC